MIKNILKIAGLLLLITLFFSCEEDSAEEYSIKERINAFEDDLNDGDYDDLADNFHPDMPSYDTYQDGSVLNAGHIAEAYYPFNFSEPSPTSGSGTVTVTGTFSNSADSGSYEANMKEDGDDNWKILKLVITIGTTQTIEGISR